MPGTCCEPLALLLAEREPSACRHAKPSARFAEPGTRSSSYDEPAGGGDGTAWRHWAGSRGVAAWGPVGASWCEACGIPARARSSISVVLDEAHARRALPTELATAAGPGMADPGDGGRRPGRLVSSQAAAFGARNGFCPDRRRDLPRGHDGPA